MSYAAGVGQINASNLIPEDVMREQVTSRMADPTFRERLRVQQNGGGVPMWVWVAVGVLGVGAAGVGYWWYRTRA